MLTKNPKTNDLASNKDMVRHASIGSRGNSVALSLDARIFDPTVHQRDNFDRIILRTCHLLDIFHREVLEVITAIECCH